MARYDYASLKGFEGKRVNLVITDGEVIEATIDWVFEEERDLSYRLLGTNRPGRYLGGTPGTIYVTPFEYIAEITPIQPRQDKP